MRTIQVCVGSSCFLHGSKKVIAEIDKLIYESQGAAKRRVLHESCTGGVTVRFGEKNSSLGLARKTLRNCLKKKFYRL